MTIGMCSGPMVSITWKPSMRRHLDIEQHQIGMPLVNGTDGLFTIATLAQHLDIVPPRSRPSSRSRASGSSSTTSVVSFCE